MLRRHWFWLYHQRTGMRLAEYCWKSLLTTGQQELFIWKLPHARVLQFFCNCLGKSEAFAKKSELGGELRVTTLAGWGCRWPQTVALGEVGIALFQKGCQHYSENLNTVWFCLLKVSAAASAAILNWWVVLLLSETISLLPRATWKLFVSRGGKLQQPVWLQFPSHLYKKKKISF